jgi:hypothetical protein
LLVSNDTVLDFSTVLALWCFDYWPVRRQKENFEMSKKNPFNLLAEETMTELSNFSDVELNSKISAVAADAVTERQRMANDEGLAQAKAEAKALAAPYKDALKAGQQLINFCVQVMQDRDSM